MTKILLVEDDKSLREIYGVRLLAEGYDIVSAGDGEEALAMAIKERPQLIVSDVMMPKISGFDMLDILRSTTETKDIKVIMMTALSSEDQRLRGQQLGADRYLVKSQVGIEDVVRMVHEVLGDVPSLSSPAVAAPTTPSAVPRPAPTSVPQRPEPMVQQQQPAQQAVTVTVTSPAAAPAPLQPQQIPVQQDDQVSTPTFNQNQSPSPVQAAQSAPFGSPSFPQPQTSLNQVAATPPASNLPQPTAPFSTPRPAGLADRIIQPLERAPDAGQPIDQLIAKELDSAPQPQEDIIPVPTAPVAPTTITPPTVASSNDQAPTDDHGISFEETPRPFGPQPQQ